MRPGGVLLGLAALVLLVAAVLVLVPGRTLAVQAPLGSTVQLDVPAGRDWAVYSTLSTWRAAACDLADADGRPIVLRPDMLQQRLPGSPTWYPQGSFRLDRDQRVTVLCTGSEGRFAVGRSAGLGHLVLTGGLGMVGVLLGLAGLILIIIGARRRGGGRVV